MMIDSVIQMIRDLYSVEGITEIIQKGGLWVLVCIVFAETGLLVGFFLPGDSLLIAAGMIAAKTSVSDMGVLNFLLAFAAVMGDQVGFWLGGRTGQAIFSRPDSRLFKKKHAVAAHEFYVKHGGKAIVLARFIPIMRTFVPFIAGVAEMPYRKFVFFNILGGALWVCGLLWIGYFLGQTRYAKDLHHIILMVVFVSVLPLIIGALKTFFLGRRLSKSVPSSDIPSQAVEPD